MPWCSIHPSSPSSCAPHRLPCSPGSHLSPHHPQPAHLPSDIHLISSDPDLAQRFLCRTSLMWGVQGPSIPFSSTGPTSVCARTLRNHHGGCSIPWGGHRVVITAQFKVTCNLSESWIKHDLGCVGSTSCVLYSPAHKETLPQAACGLGASRTMCVKAGELKLEVIFSRCEEFFCSFSPWLWPPGSSPGWWLNHPTGVLGTNIQTWVPSIDTHQSHHKGSTFCFPQLGINANKLSLHWGWHLFQVLS